MLYVGVGENVVPSNAQSTSNCLGKLLRVSPVDGAPASASQTQTHAYAACATRDCLLRQTIPHNEVSLMLLLLLFLLLLLRRQSIPNSRVPTHLGPGPAKPVHLCRRTRTPAFVDLCQ
jgi:hypothetical protein